MGIYSNKKSPKMKITHENGDVFMVGYEHDIAFHKGSFNGYWLIKLIVDS